MGYQDRRRIFKWVSPIAIIACLLISTVAISADPGAKAVPGEFLGSDLLTEDAAAAAKFYGEIFGWDVEKADDSGYAIHHKGRLIASISQIDSADPEVDESFWLVGIAVADLDKAVQAASRMGAEVREKITEVEGYGRFATIGDPQGAPLMLIEPGERRIGGTEGPGAWVWAELWTDDVDAASKFYGQVIGYQQSEVERRDQQYRVFKTGDEYRAGMVKIPAELENVEPGWAPYVGVEDLKKTIARINELGGRLIFATEDNAVRGDVALIADPGGAVLFVYEIGSATEVTE